MARFVAGWWSWRVPWLACLVIFVESPTLQWIRSFRDSNKCIYVAGILQLSCFVQWLQVEREIVEIKKGYEMIIVCPLNQTRGMSQRSGMRESRMHPQNLFTRPPIFSIATSASWASTPSPTTLAFRWLPSTSAALGLWRMEPTFKALAMA
jgi:hypothetical protein